MLKSRGAVVVPGETSAVIRWVTDQECGSRVRFGLQPDRAWRAVRDSSVAHASWSPWRTPPGYNLPLCRRDCAGLPGHEFVHHARVPGGPPGEFPEARDPSALPSSRNRRRRRRDVGESSIVVGSL